jgi:hypothetical protein
LCGATGLEAFDLLFLDGHRQMPIGKIMPMLESERAR